MWLRFVGQDRIKIQYNSIQQLSLDYEDTYSLNDLIINKDLDKVKQHYANIDENLSYSSFQLLLNNGDRLGIRCTSTIIGDQVESIWSLKSEVEKQVREALMSTAHDLRSPVNSIIGLTNILKMLLRQDKAQNEKEINSTVNMIAMCCNQAIDFTNDLLELSSMESGNYKIDSEPVEMAGFIQQYIATHRLLALKKKIKVDFVNEQDNGATVAKIDKSKITRAFDNIFTNAIKFSNSGGRIIIKLSRIEQRLAVVMKDEGIGIPDDVIKHLFIKFGKSKRQGLGGEKSHGLGLSIVKEIMELHGGEVKVTSQVGKGTEVSLLFEH